jgi:hypothetical protein
VRTCMLAELDQTGESQIDLGRLQVRVAAPPRAAEGLGRLPVRVAVAGAAVGAAATSAYTAYPPPLLPATLRLLPLSSLLVIDAPRN